MLIFGVCFLLHFLELSGVNGFMNINVCGMSNSSTFCSLKSRRIFFELVQVDLLGVLLLVRSHVAVYSKKGRARGWFIQNRRNKMRKWCDAHSRIYMEKLRQRRKGVWQSTVVKVISWKYSWYSETDSVQNEVGYQNIDMKSSQDFSVD